MAAAMSQGSEEMSDAEADRVLGINNGESQDAGEKSPPRIARDPTPDWLDKKNHPAAFPQAGDAVAGGAVAAKPPKPRLQPSGTAQLAETMSNTHFGAPAAAAVPSGSASGTAVSAAGGGGKAGEEDTDDESDDELNEEQQAKVAHVKKVEVVIFDAKAAGFTFSNQTGWSAAEAYVNNEHLFDDAGVNITECVKEGKKQINLKQVEEKLAELRAAVEEAAVAPYAGGLSQELIGESESEEEEEEEESEDEFNGLSKQTLESKKEQLEIDIGVAEAKKDDGRFGGPVKIAHRKFNKELVSFKNSPVYDAKVNPHPHPNPNP